MFPEQGLRRAWATALSAVACTIAVGIEDAVASDVELLRPFSPAVRMEKDRRAAPEEFARRAGIGKQALRERLGATGLIRCSGAVGTGQLTLRNDVITTAAHVLIGTDGKPRVGCLFEPVMGIGGGPVPIEFQSIRTGSTMPLQQPATRDWAVARLVAPVREVKAYGLAKSGATPRAVLMCAGDRTQNWSVATEQCSTRRVIGTSPDGIRELAIDCNAGPGSSGAALIAGSDVVAIYVGYRSSDPGKAQAYSETHYNFAITVDGPFRRALLATARR